ncbi:MAG: aminopeptidase P family protein [Saprospiraceae bacterium]|nr:aminopeptidase P family protein [Saprospiraceae bacterium]
MAIHIPFSSDTYKERRQSLISSMTNGQILLLANEEASINFKDNWYPYRQDSTFLYYGAISLPEMAILIDIEEGTTKLFADDVSIDMVIWTGPQPKIESLAEQVGITHTFSYNELKKHLRGQVHYLPPYRAEQSDKLKALLNTSTLSPSLELIDAIQKQRSIKTQEEVVEIEEACRLSKGMHAEVIKHIRPGIYEYELVGIASKYAFDHNVRWSFPPILTKNGNTLHNHYHGHKIEENDIVLVDGGIELASGYCGDITRTTPANGKFSSERQEIYDLVHKMYNEAIVKSTPGTPYKDVHLHAASVLVNGMKDIGLMKGDTAEAVAEGAHAMFFQHGLGHLMGLDVHDMENFGEEHIGYTDTIKKSTQFGLKSLRLGKELEVGNVITIEPGIYIIPDLIDKFQAENRFASFINYDKLNRMRHIGGMRIEDDFLITADGAKMLGGDQPMP